MSTNKKKSGQDRHYVNPRQSKDGKWEVIRSNAERASSVHDTKAQAEQAARAISRNQGTELIIRRKDGTIQRRDSHGNDPFPPKG